MAEKIVQTYRLAREVNQSKVATRETAKTAMRKRDSSHARKLPSTARFDRLIVEKL
jgi:hypothetical protein